MGKQIAIFMDGTWNDPTETTNVYKLFRLFDGTQQRFDAKGMIRSHLLKQTQSSVAFYLDGVGAHGRGQGILGGAMGIGLHDRVIDAYVLASQIYEPGDKFWIFGFSRGAWSARSLAGMIARVGMLPDAHAEDAALRAEQLWFQSKHAQDAHPLQDAWAHIDPHPMALVGVWDTVGALGVPLFNGIKMVDKAESKLFDFADLKLSPCVKYGRQALAVDERRLDFVPTLWEAREGVKQMWFAGVHSDIGGGYPHAGLSDISLQWMVDEINTLKCGLQLDIGILKRCGEFNPDPLQDRHDEARSPIWKLRSVTRKIAPDALLHESILRRLAGRNDYRPAALKPVHSVGEFYFSPEPAPEEKLAPKEDYQTARHLECAATLNDVVFAQKWWNASGLAVRAGEVYLIEATGKWQDRGHEADAAGYESAGNQVLRWAERTRRLENANWFALVAALHAEPDLELKNPTTANFVTSEIESLFKGVSAIDRQSLLSCVGNRAELHVVRDGYLYLFANDSEFAYGNNSGYLNVAITRTA